MFSNLPVDHGHGNLPRWSRRGARSGNRRPRVHGQQRGWDECQAGHLRDMHGRISSQHIDTGDDERSMTTHARECMTIATVAVGVTTA